MTIRDLVDQLREIAYKQGWDLPVAVEVRDRVTEAGPWQDTISLAVDSDDGWTGVVVQTQPLGCLFTDWEP